MKRYLLYGRGDIEKLLPDFGMLSFFELADALDYVAKNLYQYFDVEDDQIIIFSILDHLNTPTPVWHCSGWHWDDVEDLPQGKLIGRDRSMYEEISFQDNT